MKALHINEFTLFLGNGLADPKLVEIFAGRAQSAVAVAITTHCIAAIERSLRVAHGVVDPLERHTFTPTSKRRYTRSQRKKRRKK